MSRDAGRLGDRDTVGLAAFDVEADRIANLVLLGRNAAWKIRHMGRIVTASFRDDDCIVREF
jgi:hypothetical protein